MRAVLFHGSVVLSFVLVAWVNLIDKPYPLRLAFTVAELIAGLLIYITLVRLIRRARCDGARYGAHNAPNAFSTKTPRSRATEKIAQDGR